MRRARNILHNANKFKKHQMASASAAIANIQNVFQAVVGAIEPEIKPLGFETRSSGTRDPALSVAIDPSSGFWQTAGITSKPPRWILHLDASTSPATAGFALGPAGALVGSGTPGYINNGQGNCVAASFRIVPAVSGLPAPAPAFSVPPGWEWIVTFVFPRPLPEGTSGDTLSDFDPAAGTLAYKGRANQKTPFKIAHICLAKLPRSPVAIPNGAGTFTYDDATAAIAAFLSGGASVAIVDPSNPADLAQLRGAVAAALAAPVAPAAKTVTKAPHLFGIPDWVYDLINASLSIGKRHFIFYGPPGTGKTTLAEHIAGQLADPSSADDSPYLEMTGSSSWSSQDLVGGYQPLGAGEVGFVPGAMLRDFHKPIIIDELNRCPIDKVLGPIFSVLSGNPSDLPYRSDIKDPKSPSYKILPKPKAGLLANEFAPGEDWAMICTLNQMDKTQLGQLSYALTRRFIWIRLGVPLDLKAFVAEIVESRGLLRGPKDAALPNPVAEMWGLVNETREIGGAPIIDFLRLSAQMMDGIDFLAPLDAAKHDLFIACLGATVMPLLDGIRMRDGEDLAGGIARAWGLDGQRTRDLLAQMRELAA
jgi:5-methylcytosine-specific restriction protein B